ncbi:MAG TPA: helix-turn-helix domain-containing protein [Candidatus Micrarchaeaceae archaeon]|jgi:excisionase family DNA binding protein|nr:helix-turn-helix domain-containing protein [Candidatus Micrarchaeaceae archaeon]
MATAIPTLLNVRETARRLGVSEATVRNWANRGVLRAGRLPGSGFRRFDVGQIERMRQEMLTQLAPFDEGPVIERQARGRIVRGDDD